MKDILNGCKRLGIKFDDTVERIAELRDLLQNAENAREHGEHVSTAALDIVIARVKEEIVENEKKLETSDDNPPAETE